MNKKQVITGLIALLLLAGGIVYWQFRSSPTYSLLQIKSAINHRSYSEFERYVDVDKTMSSIIDQAFEIFKNSAAEEEKSALWSYFGFGMLDAIKPQLTLVYKPQVQKWVESGGFEAENPLGGENLNLLPELLKRNGTMSFDGIAYTRKKGRTAWVGFGIRAEQFDTVLVIDIRMERKSNHWQVSGVEGLPAFQRELDRMEQKRIDKLNQPLMDEMARTLKISRFDKVTVDDPKRIKSQVLIGIENIGEQPVTAFTVVVGFSDIHHNVRKEIRLNTHHQKDSTWLMPRGQFKTLSWPETGNMPLDSWLYITPLTQMFVSLKVESVVFSDGRQLRLHTKWQTD